MFTQCPACGSVFRVTADALRIAAGLVRCGVCQHDFDALAALTDESGAPPATDAEVAPPDDSPPPFDDTITVEELGAGEVIELGAANDDDSAAGDAGTAADTAAGDDAPDVAARTDAEEWLPESRPTTDADVDGEARPGDVAIATSELEEPAADAIEVNDSSVTGLEAIVLAGEDPTGEDPTGADPAASDGVDADAGGPALAAADARGSGPGSATAAGDDLEFHGSEADLERVFIATGAPVLPAFDLTALADTPTPADLPAATAVDPHAAPVDSMPGTGDERPDLDRTDEFPILVLDEQDEPLPDLTGIDSAATLDADDRDDAAGEVAASSIAGGEIAPIPLRDPRSDLAAPEPVPDIVETPQRFPIPPELRRGVVTEEAAEDDDLRFGLGDDTPRWWERRAAWVTGSVILALTLTAQVIHYNREALARDARLGPWVLRTYSLLGLPAPVPSDLEAIDLHQWGAASDNRASGRLRLRASLVNRAPFAQPYPVLRVTLHDRFGNVLGSRDVGARDYLPGGASQRRLLATGQRLDAEIVVVDPGTDAVGYEIDLCEEQRDGVRCRGTTPAPT